jgi:acyl carrier protein
MSGPASSCTESTTAERILRIVNQIVARRTAGVPFRFIRPPDDLHDSGLTSIDMVNLMLAVEAEFNVAIPDTEMTLRNFQSVSAISALLKSLIRDKSCLSSELTMIGNQA